MTKVCIVKSEYHISYDETILNDLNFENLKINLRYLLCSPPKSIDEGVYYRIIEKNKERCIQCIFFYKKQWIPYHPHDYHPFYIYLNADNRVNFLIIDDGHHFSKLIPIKQENEKKLIDITIFLPDHGLTNQITRIGKIFKSKFIPLLPNQIEKWWKINNKAQLKIRTKLIDPWASGLIPDVPHQNSHLLYRINHIIPIKIFPYAEKNFKFTFRDEVICPTCHDVETLDFIPLIYDKVSQNYFLRKKIICKKNHDYYINYNFETGQIDYE